MNKKIFLLYLERSEKWSNKILLIEDDPEVQKFITEYLKSYDYDCNVFSNPKNP